MSSKYSKMAVVFILFLFAGSLFAASSYKTGTIDGTTKSAIVNDLAPKDDFLPDQFIIKFKSAPVNTYFKKSNGMLSTGLSGIDQKLQKWNAVKIDKMFPEAITPGSTGKTDLSKIYTVNISQGEDLLSAIADFNSDSQVEYAEPVYIYAVDRVPNDPQYSQQYHYAIAMAEEAWGITTGSKDVIISIIDTGVDWMHSDLNANIWINPGEDLNHNGVIEASEENGIDDDHNGKIDDFRGWDFFTAYNFSDDNSKPAVGEDGDIEDNNPMDFDGHGTHCAGIATGVTDNGTGIAGTGWNCTIMPLRAGYQTADGRGVIVYGYAGIKYAADNGADIISVSWGGSSYSQYSQDVINYAWEKGVIIFGAAGNGGIETAHYPGSYEHVVSVASIIHDVDIKANFSNYGTTVDVCAPGTQILSTLPGSTFGRLQGTSMSCPMVAGLAGLVKSLHPDWTPDHIALQILETADKIDDKNPQYKGLLGYGRINMYRALTENPSSVQVVDYKIDDSVSGNDNGIVDFGETVNLTISLTSFLDDVSNVTANITVNDAYVTIQNGSNNFGNIAKEATVTNASSPFVFTAANDAPIGHMVSFKINITANNGAYSTSRYINVFIQPLYDNHDINNVDFTITSFGIYGFNDYAETGEYFGSGFKYPKDSESALYLGSLWIGTGANQVSDCSYGNAVYDNYDFITSDNGYLKIEEGVVSDQDGTAIFNDSRAESPLGVEVLQKSYAWQDSPNDDYVILEYSILNTTTTALNNVYVGLYMDWDINASDNNLNSVGYDDEHNLGYMYSAGSNYYGISMVYPEPASYRAIDNSVSVYNNSLTENLKYQFLSGGFSTVSSNNPNDWSHVLSTGPINLQPGERQIVSFAVLGGDNLNDLKANAQAAMDKYFPLAPAKIQITHEPLKDTENTLLPVPVIAFLEPGLEQVNPDSVFVFWKTQANVGYYKAKMTDLGNTVFTGEIPAQSEKQVDYYIMAKDVTGRSSKLPADAPVSYFTFYAGTDTEKPVISDMTQLGDTFNSSGPFSISVKVTDNLGVNAQQVKVHYSVNGGEEFSNTMIRTEMTDIYTLSIGLVSPLSSGDKVSYYVSARDISVSQNSATSDVVQFSIVNSLLIDNFEGDLDKWEAGSGWGTYFFAYEGANSVTDSPNGYYSPNADTKLTLLESFDLSKKSMAAVSFYYIYSLSTGDTAYFEASKNGRDWTGLVKFAGESGYVWQQQIVSLTKFTGATGQTVRLRFRLISNNDGDVSDGLYVDQFVIHADTLMTSVATTNNALPTVYSLAQNYPNPFNPTTTISYDIPEMSDVTIEIFSILGERVRTLVSKQQAAGRYTAIWDGRSDTGVQTSTGVYFYKIKANSFVNVKKMILLK